ncbi:class I SAM-dependent DNA methyltransferase [Parafrankia sp. FMc2]|uniref:class I SAM-dependent DNA methyltransferase n=1 Tax=Parafrankia sp. FMc2 TaxID=3233196 RepID=UPI0034D56AF4
MSATRAQHSPDGLTSYGDGIADVYDDWYSGPEKSTAETPAVDFLQAHAGDGPVLELGIGTGRVALPLAARGVTVAGIEASGRMVARLQEKPGGREIPVATGDFADVAAPGGPFEMVFVVFNTFFMLTEQETQVRCFRNVAAALRPGGAFVVEAFVPDVTLFDHGQRVQVDDLTGHTARISLTRHDPITQRVHVRHLTFGPAGQQSYPLTMRYAWSAELDLMGRLAGLELAERWGGWSRQPLTAASGLHVSVWRKPAVPGG